MYLARPALIIAALACCAQAELFSTSTVSPSSCVASAVDAGRRVYAAQEIFYKCYKDCTKGITSKGVGNALETPEFSSNFVSLAKSVGMSMCSKICFEKIVGEIIPATTSSQPFIVYEKIAKTLLQCAATDQNDAFYATDLAQFNIDNLNQTPDFTDPRKRRLFSIFYPDHLQTFWAGMTKYEHNSKNCPDILMSMRSALAAYANNLNLCQHWCLISLASPASQKTESFTSFVSISRCQLSCFYLFRADPSAKKSLLHPVSEIEHYLQYCLWHTGAQSEAYSHAASFSHLEPFDTSLYDYYVGGGKIAKANFVPRPDAVHLREQLHVLNSVLKINDDMKSGIVNGAPSNLGAILNSLKVYESGASKQAVKETTQGTCDAADPFSCSITENDMRTVGNFSGNDNHRRYVVDDVLDLSQCLQFVNMNARAGRNGDGYPATKKAGSPYTEHESYVGLAAHRLAELAADGVLLPEEVMLFFSTSDAILHKTKQLYGLKELYFYYVHLVCREAINARGDTGPDRVATEDPSHPIHADNCAIQPDGDCLLNDPLLTPRNYSAVLYLNDDFEGGEFFFAHRPNKTEDKKVNPRCGRFVSFHASEFHGVRAVTMGTRCSLALWFTMDKSKEEHARADAYRIVSQLAAVKDAIPPEPVGPDVTGRAF